MSSPRRAWPRPLCWASVLLLVQGPSAARGAPLLFAPPPLLHLESVVRPPSPQQSSSNSLDDAIEAAVKQTMEDWGVTGAAVGVVKNHTVIYSGGFGFADKAKGIPATERTLFQIASTSKAFTTLLALMLEEEGQISLDKPVWDALPSLRLGADTLAESLQHLTMRDMFSHRTGLPRHDIAGFTSRSRSELVAKLRFLQADRPLRYNPGEYSNMMFVTAGAALEAKLGAPWEEAMTSRVFGPLGMQRTWANLSSVPASEAAELSRPYSSRTEVPYLNVDVSAPAGAIVSNVEDMLKWLQLHLRQGAPPGVRPPGPLLVKPETYSELLKGNTLFPLYTQFDQYSLGWWITLLPSRDRALGIVTHGGNLNGFSTAVGFMPTEGHAVVVLTNEDGSPSRDVLLLQLFDILTGTAQPVPSWSERFRLSLAAQEAREKEEAEALQKKIASTPPAGRRPQFPLAAYEGTYASVGAYGNCTVQSLSSPALLQACGHWMQNLTAPWQAGCLNLTHAWYDTFLAQKPFGSPVPLPVAFLSDGDGKVVQVEVQLEPQVSPIVFTRVPAPVLEVIL